MNLYAFEKLDVWQLSRKLNLCIYEITKQFPHEDRYILTSQIRSSSNSISANIAEGISRTSVNEKIRFLNIAYGSAIETLNHLILCFDIERIDEKTYLDIRNKIEQLTNKLNSLINYFKKANT
jgi:four helix bundle protein